MYNNTENVLSKRNCFLQPNFLYILLVILYAKFLFPEIYEI